MLFISLFVQKQDEQIDIDHEDDQTSLGNNMQRVRV